MVKNAFRTNSILSEETRVVVLAFIHDLQESFEGL